VFVNIPAFRLEAREEGRPVLSMRVVAGEPETATPVMRDEISYLEFSPYWNVPDSITRNTLLPRIAANPRHLTEQGYDVLRGWGETDIIDPSGIDWEAAVQGKFPYRLRQRPGPTNAMGLVKFMFPNDDAIYLHDTPADHRFEERRRAFSHGCVRVEEPAALAQFLLNDPRTWPRDAVERAMQDGTRQVVPLPEYVPVHLRYFTVWVEEGQVQFRADLYGLDAEEGRAIAASTEDDR
jgi:L,D-transpeptidase YcbB